MKIFKEQLVAIWKLRIAAWLGWPLLLINSPTVIWLIRPYPKIDSNTGLVATLWLVGLVFSTWSLSGFAWNQLLSKGHAVFDEPLYSREYGGKNDFEEQLATLVRHSKILRNSAFISLFLGVTQVAYNWTNQSAYTCSLNNDGESSCSNDMAMGATLLVIGVVLLSAWGFYSHRHTKYFEEIEPAIRLRAPNL